MAATAPTSKTAAGRFGLPQNSSMKSRADAVLRSLLELQASGDGGVLVRSRSGMVAKLRAHGAGVERRHAPEWM